MARVSALIASVFLFAAPAFAATEITVAADQARMISIPGEPGTVVVGNPNIADVTISGKNVFVHGRNYGTTNVIFVDRDGNQIAALDVTVVNGGASEVSIFRAGSRFSYNCSGDCEAASRIGDNTDYFKGVAEQNTTKSGLATGSQKIAD